MYGFSYYYILPQVLLLRAPSCVDAVIITLNWSSLYNNNLLIIVDFEVVLVLRYMYLVARRWVHSGWVESKIFYTG